MKWTIIPTKTIIFRTKLSPEEVLQRVQTLLDTQDAKKALYLFEGKIGPSGFEIWEIHRPRGNSFIPSVKAEVLSDEEGNFIRVVMRLNGCAFVFALVWCYPLGLALLLALLGLFRGEKVDWDWFFSILFILLMMGFMITMTTLGFRSGVKSAREFLAKTLMMNDE